jgi:hypothetical protein
MPLLNKSSHIIIHGDDSAATNNPQKRFVDWRKGWLGVSVEDPESQRITLAPSETKTIFSGTRTLGVDGTTEFDLELNSYTDGLYRLVNTAGTVPGFRTNRGLALTGFNIDVTINNNATATFTSTPINGFAGVQIGDIVFMPHTTTGDSASPFNVDNVGEWQVLSNTGTILVAKRLAGVDFSGASELAVAITDDAQFQAFSSSGVQVGDTLELSAGFSTVTQKTYIIQTVTADRLEFLSTEPLPLESGIIPGAAGITVYSNAKRYLKVETDQEAVIRLNGDTGNTNRLQPMIVADSDNMAFFEKWGPVWSLVIVNRSSSVMNVDLITAE